MALRTLGRLDDAIARFGQIWETARHAVLPVAMTEMGYWYGDTLASRGRFGDARAIAEETIRIGERIREPRAVSDARWVLRLVDLSQADWRTTLRAIEADIAAEAEPHSRIEPRHVAANVRVRLGDAADLAMAADQLAEAAVDVRAASCRRCRLESLLRGAETRARMGDPDRARESLVRWSAERPRETPMATYRLRLAEGLIAPQQGDPDGARSRLRAALEGAERIGARIEATRTLIDLAIASRDDRTAAAALLRDAAGRASDLGATTEQREAERALRNLGVRTWRRTPAAPATVPHGAAARLSRREVEVARLVAGGASNREIAAALFVSPRTVETHISNLLAKLDARNRTELALRVASDEAHQTS
jgi:DNA-binding CsgD family transcriptional regulator